MEERVFEIIQLLLTDFEIHVKHEESVRKIINAQQKIKALSFETSQLMASNKEKEEMVKTLEMQLDAFSVGHPSFQNEEKKGLFRQQMQLIDQRAQDLARTADNFLRGIEGFCNSYKNIYVNLSWSKEKALLRRDCLGAKIQLNQIICSIEDCADARRMYKEMIEGPLQKSVSLDVAKLSVEGSNSRKRIENLSKEYDEKSKLVKSLREQIALVLNSPSNFKMPLFQKPSDSPIVLPPQPNRFKDVLSSFKSFTIQLSKPPDLQNNHSPPVISKTSEVQVEFLNEGLKILPGPNLKSPSPTSLPANLVPTASEASCTESRVEQVSKSKEPEHDKAISEKKKMEALPNPEGRAERVVLIATRQDMKPRASVVAKVQAPAATGHTEAGPCWGSVNVPDRPQMQPQVKRVRSRTPLQHVPARSKQVALPSAPQNSPTMIIDLTTSSDDENVSLKRQRQPQPVPLPIKKPKRVLQRSKNVTFENVRAPAVQFGKMQSQRENQQPQHLKHGNPQTNRNSQTAPGVSRQETEGPKQSQLMLQPQHLKHGNSPLNRNWQTASGGPRQPARKLKQSQQIQQPQHLMHGNPQMDRNSQTAPGDPRQPTEGLKQTQQMQQPQHLKQGNSQTDRNLQTAPRDPHLKPATEPTEKLKPSQPFQKMCFIEKRLHTQTGVPAEMKQHQLLHNIPPAEKKDSAELAKPKAQNPVIQQALLPKSKPHPAAEQLNPIKDRLRQSNEVSQLRKLPGMSSDCPKEFNSNQPVEVLQKPVVSGPPSTTASGSIPNNELISLGVLSPSASLEEFEGYLESISEHGQPFPDMNDFFNNTDIQQSPSTGGFGMFFSGSDSAPANDVPNTDFFSLF